MKILKVMFVIFVLFLTIQPTFSKTQGHISLNELIGNINFKKDENFISLDHSGIQTNKPNMYVQKEVLQSLLKVKKQFLRAFPNAQFVVLSAARTFEYQQGIWNRKWNRFLMDNNSPNKIRDLILEYSSLPGTSRHHWGTDIDIISVDPDYFNTTKGKKIYAWLVSHLPGFGFEQAFTAGRENGYKEEKWHWSYVPLAKKYIRSYKEILKKPEELIKKIRSTRGFSEKEISEPALLELIQTYVFDINPNCL